MSVVRLIVATRSSNILISGKIIKEMPGSVASGTHCIILFSGYEHSDIQLSFRRSFLLCAGKCFSVLVTVIT